MEIEVNIESIGETQTYGANGFRKREVVGVTLDDKYPQPLLFEFIQDRTEDLNNFAEGETVNISFNLRGNRWQPQGKPEKIFVSLNGWKIEKAGDRSNSAVNQYEENQQGNEDNPDPDLPF